MLKHFKNAMFIPEMSINHTGFQPIFALIDAQNLVQVDYEVFGRNLVLFTQDPDMENSEAWYLLQQTIAQLALGE